ncbi:MAG: hypothetical protein JRI23_10290 [Deltaproteobacteria bacterium]|nr:hypothetical protein [Deltaproteobacteria bacterium]MBW2532057.1 hypothetical protein [Deltaproteobacteria bacterium]
MLREQLWSHSDLPQQAMSTLFFLNYFPTRFAGSPRLYRETHERRPLLDLPFRSEEFVGVVLPEL